MKDKEAEREDKHSPTSRKKPVLPKGTKSVKAGMDIRAAEERPKTKRKGKKNAYQRKGIETHKSTDKFLIGNSLSGTMSGKRPMLKVSQTRSRLKTEQEPKRTDQGVKPPNRKPKPGWRL